MVSFCWDYEGEENSGFHDAAAGKMINWLFAGWPCKVKMMLGRQVDRTKLGSNFHFFPLRKWDIRDSDNDDDWLTDGMGKFIW